MTAASPWSVKGIDPKAREMAKDLARRSGMTLGEWLNQMIIDGEVDPPTHAPSPSPLYGYRGIPTRDYVAPEEAPAPAKAGELQRIARALDQLSARMEAAEHRSTLAISGIDQSVMGVLSRMEAIERDQGAVAARFDSALDDVRQDQARASEKVRRMAEEDGPRLEALKALEGALGKLAEKLYEGEAKTRGTLNDLREDLSNLSRRIDRTDAKVEAEPAGGVIEGVVARIADRLEQAEAKTSGAVKALEQSFADLDARLRANETRTVAEAEGKLERLAADLSEKVAAARAEMADRLKDAADGKFDRMEQALRDLAGHVEQGERRSAQAIDRMGREVMRVASTLGERVGKVEARSAEAAGQMGGEMARIADAMEKRLARQDTAQAQALEKLGGEITRIAEKLAERIANSERRSTQTIEDVGEQLGRVTERLNQRYDRAQTELAERIQQSETRTAKLLEEAREKIDARLTDAQRRSALEAAQEAARRAALVEEAPGPVAAADPADPFAGAPFAAEAAVAPMATHDPFAEPPAFKDAAFKAPAFGAEDAFAPVAAPPVAHDPFAATIVADPFAAPPPFTPETPAAAFAEPAFAPEAPRPPSSTREMLEQARAAMRAADKPDPRGRRDAAPSGAVPVPPFEGEPSKLFGLSLPKRKKKDGVTLRTALVASGTAAALAVTGAGAVLLINAETGSGSGDHAAEPFGVAPTAAVADAEAPATAPAAAPTAAPAATPAPSQMAMAVTPPPGQAEGLKTAPPPPSPAVPSPVTTTPVAPPAETPTNVRVLYSAAVRRIESGDLGGVSDLKRAANLGHAPAQFYLAKLYETGGAGLKKDLSEARRWTERAAENGDVSAMHNLGLYYYEGEAGEQDAAKAAQWFQKAATQGVKDSQYNLAMLYAKGYGVPKNPAEAYKWYLVAAAAGDEGAKDAAKAIRPQLTPEAQSAAEHAAAAFHAQTQGLIRTAAVTP